MKKEKIYFVKEIKGRHYVLVDSRRETSLNGINIGQANFMNTGMALAGVLKENETLIDFKKRLKNK